MPSTSDTIGISIAVGTDKLHGKDCVDAILASLAAGYRSIDTAQAYGNEENIGEALRQSDIPRGEINVSTKISDGFCSNPSDTDRAYESALASIRRLGVSSVDLFLVHAPGTDDEARRATWQALERLVDEGFAKSIGVSNYGEKHLIELRAYARFWPPKVNQIELHPWCQQRNVVQFCRSQGIEVQAACALVRNRRSSDPGLHALATKYGKSTAQMLIRYSIQKGWTPVVKAGNPAHLRENANVHDFSIGIEDMCLMDTWDEGNRGAICESL
ncbi:Aldo/keto reductase [Astrocystis sublimbata]|nr:Aldo/keto reductase [Astrocystis sublimbata]